MGPSRLVLPTPVLIRPAVGGKRARKGSLTPRRGKQGLERGGKVDHTLGSNRSRNRSAWGTRDLHMAKRKQVEAFEGTSTGKQEPTGCDLGKTTLCEGAAMGKKGLGGGECATQRNQRCLIKKRKGIIITPRSMTRSFAGNVH